MRPRFRDVAVSRGSVPVLYLNDGQNLFDPSRAFAGNTWRAAETVNRLVRQHLIPPLLVVGIGASLGGPTGYAINPARDLGPRIAHAILPIPGKGTSSDWPYAWIPVVAPIAGGIAGAALYSFVGF